MNNDLISRNALVENYERFLARASIDPIIRAFMTSVLCTVENAPAVDAAPVRHGRWIHDTNNLFGCSECMERDTMSFRRGLKNYCPNCGAKMDGDVNA